MANETILIVDDDPYMRDILNDILTDACYHTIEACDGKEALSLLEQNSIDLMLLDLALPRVPGMEVLRQTVAKQQPISVVIISGKGTIRTAVEATKLGAYDFLEKPVEPERTLLTIRNALEKQSLKRQRDRLLSETHQRYRMIGTSAAMQRIYRLIDRAATIQSKVLITGEHGTGKEVVARAIHYNSDRAAGPFVAVNCAAIPENLIESELFGYEKGAFTGANKLTPGKFEQAGGGTLFLDEIGDMSLMTQAKTLRALDLNVITRVGGMNTVHVDTRIIAATNKNLEQEIAEGNFREDLFYRLNVLTISLPPLKDHREDIPELAHHFQQIFSEENGIAKPIQPEALSLLVEYDWIGNIRQLKNVVERLLILSDGPAVTAADVSDTLQKPYHLPTSDFHESRQQFERGLILKTLVSNEWKVLATAQALGIDRSYLWKKMQQYDLNRKHETFS